MLARPCGKYDMMTCSKLKYIVTNSSVANLLTRKQVPTWKKSDFRHTTRLDRPLPGWGCGGAFNCTKYKIGFLQIPDASNKCSATKQKLVNFPWKRLLERCVRARVPRFHNFSGVGDKNWVQLRPLEHNLIFIEDLGGLGSWMSRAGTELE